MNKEKFLAGISSPINPELSNILMKLGIIEQSGKGINTIVRKYGENVFKFSDEYLQVELPYNIEVLNTQNEGENVGVNVGVNLSLNKNTKNNVEINYRR